jgi:CHAT domain-containing protein/tetratricopeptide (TPR) repeat protein
MNVSDMLNRGEEELRNWALLQDSSVVHEGFDAIWQEIRKAHLYAGQPRSAASQRGVALARVCLQVAERRCDEQLKVLAWRMLAYTLTANEQYEESLQYHHRAIQALDAAGDAGQAARARLGYIAALFHTGRYQEALRASAVAEDWFRKNNDEVGFARLCNNVANLYERLDEHALAYRYQQMHSDIVRKTGDRAGLAKSYLNLGNSLAAMDRFEEADEMYASCEALSLQLGMGELCAQASYNRAHLYFMRGRYGNAFESFRRIRQHFEQSGSLRHYALCDRDEAEIYIQLNLSKDAAALALRAAEQFKELGLRYEQAKSTAFFGLAMLQMRRYGAALDAFQAAQEMFAAEGNSYWTALLDLYRSEIQLSLNSYSEARELASRAKALFEGASFLSNTILCLVQLGRIALALNDLAGADHIASEVSKRIDAARVPLLLFPCYLFIAEIAEKSGNLDRAEQFYRLAVEDLELHQRRLCHDDLRVTFLNDKHRPYEALVELALRDSNRSNPLAAAYSWAERSKSRALIDLLSEHMPAVQAGSVPALVAKAGRLREELNVLYSRSKPDARSNVAGRFQEIVRKEDELARTLREISISDPEYSSLQQEPAGTIESVQQVLPDDTTLVEYFISRDEVLAFIVSRTGAEVYRRLCSSEQIKRIQNRLAFHLEAFLLGDDYLRSHSDRILESTKTHLIELHRLVFARFAQRIQTRHIVVVPHGSLHLLPFHALADGSRYVIDDFEVSYAPSASVLKHCLQKEDVRGAGPLLVGISDETTPFVTEELRDLASMFPNSALLLNESATRAAFRERSRRTSFLHIASHGVFRQDNPMFSGFKLADGWMTALDLFASPCESNLVTLSGCKSGMTQVTGSDDLLGLMRGFLYSGARSLMLSLWNVDDECTARLMSHFYTAWRTGMSKSKALNLAMRAVRKDFANPFYWAPFLLIGKP